MCPYLILSSISPLPILSLFCYYYLLASVFSLSFSCFFFYPLLPSHSPPLLSFPLSPLSILSSLFVFFSPLLSSLSLSYTTSSRPPSLSPHIFCHPSSPHLFSLSPSPVVWPVWVWCCCSCSMCLSWAFTSPDSSTSQTRTITRCKAIRAWICSFFCLLFCNTLMLYDCLHHAVGFRQTWTHTMKVPTGRRDSLYAYGVLYRFVPVGNIVSPFSCNLHVCVFLCFIGLIFGQ